MRLPGGNGALWLSIAVGLSVLGMAVHTVTEFGYSGLLDPRTGMVPFVTVQASLLVLWWIRPSARSGASLALLATALLQLIGGAVLSILPLPFLPFAPDQTVSHYLSHIVLGITQIPLIVIPWLQHTEGRQASRIRSSRVVLRDVTDNDLPIFFDHESDPAANYMAAFTRTDPSDRDAFDAHWTRVRADPTILIQTILFDGHVAGSVLSYQEGGRPEVSYWIGREYWGKGIATRALSEFLRLQTTRPIYARVAKDNLPSIRVLEKCGFRTIGKERGLANARGAEIEELLLELRADEGASR